MDSLHSEALPAAATKAHVVFFEPLGAAVEPALRVESRWVGKDHGVHEDEVIALADGCLESMALS